MQPPYLFCAPLFPFWSCIQVSQLCVSVWFLLPAAAVNLSQSIATKLLIRLTSSCTSCSSSCSHSISLYRAFSILILSSIRQSNCLVSTVTCIHYCRPYIRRTNTQKRAITHSNRLPAAHHPPPSSSSSPAPASLYPSPSVYRDYFVSVYRPLHVSLLCLSTASRLLFSFIASSIVSVFPLLPFLVPEAARAALYFRCTLSLSQVSLRLYSILYFIFFYCVCLLSLISNYFWQL